MNIIQFSAGPQGRRNVAPDIVLSGNSIAEDAEVGDLVGLLSVANFDGEGTFSLGEGTSEELALDEGDNTRLEVASPLDRETKPTLTAVVVFTPNEGDGPTPRTFTISVTNVIEAPVFLSAPVVTGALDGILTCSTGVLEMPDGAGATFAYQWKDADDDSDLEGETGNTLDTQDYIGIEVKCTVTATNSADSTSEDSNTVGPLEEAEEPATLFYVDPEGSDSNDGLTPETAWATIAKVNATTFVPGSSILFKSGATFEGQLTLIEGRHFGEAGNPITFGATDVTPAIIEIAALDEYAIRLIDPHHVTVQDFHAIGPGIDTGEVGGIWGSNNYLENSKLQGVILRRVIVEEFGSDGISFSMGSDPWSWDSASGFDGLLIEDVIVHDCTGNAEDWVGNGISVQGLGGLDVNPPSHTNVTIRRATVYNCTGHTAGVNHTGSGIILGQCEDSAIEDCLAYNNGELSQTTAGPVGIWMYDCTRTWIRRSVSHSNKTGSGKPDGGGFDLDGGCVDCGIEHCFSYDNHGPGYLLYQYSGSPRPASGNIIRFNITQNDGRQATKGSIRIETDDNRDQPNNYIYGNTIYSDVANSIGLVCGGSYGNRFVDGCFANNTIAMTGASSKLIDCSTMPSSFDIVHNLYHTPIGFSVDWGASNYASMAAWRSAAGVETISGNDTSQQGDPLFADTLPIASITVVTDTAIEAYKTLAGSPARGRGIDVVDRYELDSVNDFFGNEVPQGAWDIGAFEGANTVPGAFAAGQWSIAAGDEEADVTISSLPATGGAAITDIEYRLDGGSAVSSGGTSGFTIGSLTNDAEVDVQVRAVNSVGAGAWSDTKPVTPEGEEEEATVPDAFVLANWDLDPDTEALDITINALPANGGASITDIEYRIRQVGGSYGSAVSTGGTGSFSITSLLPLFEREVQIRAINSEGAGEWSDTKQEAAAAQGMAFLMTAGIDPTTTGYWGGDGGFGSISAEPVSGASVVGFLFYQEWLPSGYAYIGIDSGAPTLAAVTGKQIYVNGVAFPFNSQNWINDGGEVWGDWWSDPLDASTPVFADGTTYLIEIR